VRKCRCPITLINFNNILLNIDHLSLWSSRYRYLNRFFVLLFVIFRLKAYFEFLIKKAIIQHIIFYYLQYLKLYSTFWFITFDKHHEDKSKFAGLRDKECNNITYIFIILVIVK